MAYHIITNNKIPVKNIHEYSESFIVVHSVDKYNQLGEKNFIPTRTLSKHTRISIFYQCEIMLDPNEFTNDAEITFELHPVTTFTEALYEIAAEIADAEYEESLKPKESQEEQIAVIACQNDVNKQVLDFMKRTLRDMKSSVDCMNLYKSLRCVDTDRLANLLKSELGTEFIYPDDPIVLAKAISLYL